MKLRQSLAFVLAIAACAPPPPPARVVAAPVPIQYVPPQMGLNNSGLDTSLPAALDKIVKTALDDAVAPGVAIAVGRNGRIAYMKGYGTIDWNRPGSPAVDTNTLYDLASLTKVIATTSLAMRLVEWGQLALDDPIAELIPDWRGHDREHVTLRSLLAHSSGLTAYLPFYRDHKGRAEFQHAICSLPLEYTPDTQSIYSDLGFILLGFIIEDAGVGRFEGQAVELLRQVTARHLLFNPPAAFRPVIAPTEHDPWRGRRLVGEVHDENCWALGGAAGHAGLFGTADAVGDFARAMLGVLDGTDGRLASEPIAREFVTRASAYSSRALGWDTMLPTSSCGGNISASAFGHTGFTGTTLWIDPERAIYVVFLTNRVNPTRENTAITQIRPAFHDAVFGAIGR